jgi:phosphonate transport system substrate-binding protein
MVRIVSLLLAPLLVAVVLAAAAGPRPAAAQVSVVQVPGLRIGVVAGREAAPITARLEPFRLRLGDELGVPVRVTAMKDALTLADALATHKIDYAILSATAYAAAFQLCSCIEPLVVPASIDGTAAWRSVVVTRGEGSAETIQDLKGKVLAAAAAPSIGGRLFPFAALAGQGIEPERFFARVETTGGPEAALKLMLAGKADAAVVWSTMEGEREAGYGRGTLHDLVEKRAMTMKDVRVVWQSPLVPHGPHAVRTDLPAAQKARLVDVLLRLKDNDPDAYDAVEPTFGGGFVRVGHLAYEPLFALVAPRRSPDQPARPAEPAGKPAAQAPRG